MSVLLGLWIGTPNNPRIPGPQGVWQYVGEFSGWATKEEVINVLEEMTWG